MLEAFERALRRETQNLTQRPDLLGQQLHNRLQWEDEPVPRMLEPERERRSAPGADPWMRTRTPFRESRALIRTLAGHSDSVWGCAVSPDGAFVVSASDDGTLKLWDPASGEELRTLAGHSGRVRGCAVSPDGAFVVSASYDRTLKLWDPASGTAVSTVPLLGTGNCVALHPWLPLAVCGDSGGSLYLIDLVGIEYGPIVVTAMDRGEGPALRCPACWQEHSLDERWLGTVIDCPTPSCDLQLRVNPFVIRRARPTSRRLWRRR